MRLLSVAAAIVVAGTVNAETVTYDFSGQFDRMIDLTATTTFPRPETRPGGTFSGFFTVEIDPGLPETIRATSVTDWLITVNVPETQTDAAFVSDFSPSDRFAPPSIVYGTSNEIRFNSNASGVSAGCEGDPYQDSTLTFAMGTNQYIGVADTLEMTLYQNAFGENCFPGFGVFQRSIATQDMNDGQGGLSTVTATLRIGDVAPVPLPAAGWALLAGVGMLGAMRKRR